MRKIYEFVNINDDYKISNILEVLDGYTFYTDGKWMFVESADCFPSDLIGIISPDEFFEIGKKISEELNKDKLSIKSYKKETLKTYFNKIIKH